MECNRDEAERAKGIAEKRLMGEDIEGSYRFAQKAYKLYPGLEGLSHLLTAIEVHLAAQRKVDSSGLMDWYAILQVSTSFESDHAFIKKQYKKLALVLHPDKNKSVGAEGAFKLIREAWGLLSDKRKKATYDNLRKRLLNVQGHSYPRVPPDPTPNNGKGPDKHNVRCTSNSKRKGDDVPSVKKKKKKSDVNVNAETVDSSFSASPSRSPSPSILKLTASGKSATFWAVCSSCRMVQACLLSQEGQSIQCGGCSRHFVAVEGATISINDHHTKRIRKGSSGSNTNINRRTKIEVEGESGMNGSEDKDNNLCCAEEDHTKRGKRKSRKLIRKSKRRKKQDSVSFKEDPSVKIVDPLSIDVVDADFYDFDQDRTENCFEENQIWAIYDVDDAMPRYYALINKVISLHPFKVQMSWLEGKDNHDENLIKWANAGFWRSCGGFVVGRKTVTEFLNVFSHVMKGEKAVAGELVKIFPRRGTVWAVYRDWQPNWDKGTPQEVRHGYEIVEIITDFKETLGGSVVSLVKLNSFKSVYQKQQTGSQAIRWILKTEFLRFSHQIPARRLLGNEAQHLPKGCWELDPAATPLD